MVLQIVPRLPAVFTLQCPVKLLRITWCDLLANLLFRVSVAECIWKTTCPTWILPFPP